MDARLDGRHVTRPATSILLLTGGDDMMIVVAAISFAAGGLFGMLLTAVLVAGRYNWEDEDGRNDYDS